MSDDVSRVNTIRREAYSDGWEACLEAVVRLNPDATLPLSPRHKRATEEAWDRRYEEGKS